MGAGEVGSNHRDLEVQELQRRRTAIFLITHHLASQVPYRLPLDPHGRTTARIPWEQDINLQLHRCSVDTRSAETCPRRT